MLSRRVRTPDYDPDSKPYFAFGSAVFEGDHGDEYMKVLRARASRTGVQSGFHASHDSNDTKQCFFECIDGMDVKFNATFMAKQRAYPYVKARGNLWLYKWTLYTHTGALVRQLWDGKSRIVVHLVVAKINLSKREKAVKDAVRDVCAHFDREQVHVVPHIWDSELQRGTAGGLTMGCGRYSDTCFPGGTEAAITTGSSSRRWRTTCGIHGGRWKSEEKLRSAIRFHGKTPVVFLSPILTPMLVRSDMGTQADMVRL